MRGAADRQKLGEALDESKDRCLKHGHGERGEGDRSPRLTTGR
jgi:hypothetical protein